MITYADFCRLRQLHDHDRLDAAQIAAEMRLHPQTVAKWIAQPTYTQRASTRPRTSKLDAFKGTISHLLARFDLGGDDRRGGRRQNGQRPCGIRHFARDLGDECGLRWIQLRDKRVADDGWRHQGRFAATAGALSCGDVAVNVALPERGK